MESIPGFIVSIISGLYTSSWGAYKDSPFEGLKFYTYPRSVVFSAVIFIILSSIPDIRVEVNGLNLARLFFLVMGIERASSEVYKGFFRNECQKKYFIPSRITFLGRYIPDMHRYYTGIALFICALATLFLDIEIENFYEYVIVSFCTGFTTALGGAYKDAPYEGFEPAKFIRSPIILMICSPILFLLGPVSMGLLIYMNWGLERFIVEYYKTFVLRTRSGKFRPDIQKNDRFNIARKKLHTLALIIAIGIVLIIIYDIFCN